MSVVLGVKSCQSQKYLKLKRTECAAKFPADDVVAGAEGCLEVEECEVEGQEGRHGEEEEGADVPGDATLGPPHVAGPERHNVTHEASHVRHGSVQLGDGGENDQSTSQHDDAILQFSAVLGAAKGALQFRVLTAVSVLMQIRLKID